MTDAEIRLSRRVRELAPSETLALAARAKELRQAGQPVIDFSVGEPDFGSPIAAGKAALSAIERGDTHYPPVPGTPALKQAILARLQSRTGWEAAPSEVIVGNGAKHVLYNLMQALLDPGDEVVFQSPYWVSYPAMVQMAGGRPVPIPTRAEDGFRFDPAALEAALSPRTRVLILNSPSNPTGAVTDPADLEALVRLALERDLIVISDEIYGELVFAGAEHRSALQVDDPRVRRQVILVDGVSKTFAMTGWRVGWAVGPADIIAACGKVQSQSTSGVCSIAQAAAAGALAEGGGWADTMRQAFATRRNIAVDELRAIPGVVVPEARGAFYAFPDFSAYFGRRLAGVELTGSVVLSQLLLEQAHVAAVPGAAFGADAHLRFSYALEDDLIREGIGRVAALLARSVS